MSSSRPQDPWGDVQQQLEALRAVVPDLADLPAVGAENAAEVLSRVVQTTESLRRRVLRDRIVRSSLHELMGALLRGRDAESTLEGIAAYLCQVLGVGEVLIVQRESEERSNGFYAARQGKVERLGRIAWRLPEALVDAAEAEHATDLPEGDPEAARTDPRRYGLILPLEGSEPEPSGRGVIGYLAMNGLRDEEADWSPQEIARRVAGMLETLVHRTERERADRFRRHLLEAMQDGVLALDSRGTVLEANAGAVRVLGGRSADLRGTAIRAYANSAPALVEHLLHTLRTRSRAAPREVAVLLEGKRTPFNVAVSFLSDSEGAFHGIVVNLTDLTTLREMEAQIDRLDRLAALGRFAAGVAHEVRNPLAGIGAGVEYLARAFAPDAPQQRDVRYVLGEVQRLNSIVADLLDYTQPRPLQREPIVAAELAERVRMGLAPYAREREVRLEVGGPRRARLSGDAARLEQVLLNLVRNGIEATPPGGLVTLAWHESGGFRFVIEDEGPGFSEEQSARAFEPFFTTKGNGTGLGLYLSHSIVEQHGGRLLLQNRERRGASIRIELPQLEEERISHDACVHSDR